MKMNKNEAVKFVIEIMNCMNPEKWNGFGEIPKSIDLGNLEMPLNKDLYIEVCLTPSVDGELMWKHFENPDNNNGWMWFICLICDGDFIESKTVYGIDSINNLAGAILDLCNMVI